MGYDSNFSSSIKYKVISVVVGALGTTPKKLKQQLSDIRIETIVGLQKTTSNSSGMFLRFKESC